MSISSNKTVGSFESVIFPEFNGYEVVAKIDTGAFTGALHCTKIREEEEKKLDTKTGLLTVSAFRDETEKIIAKQRKQSQYGHRHADTSRGAYLLFMDLDDFKQLNHVFNNDVVDEKILFPAVDQLEQAVRGDNDLIGRHGGDEFMVLLTDVDKNICEAIVQRIRNSINTVRIPQNGPYPRLWSHLGVSIGVAEYTDDLEYADVFSKAHTAHLVSKTSQEKNRIVFAD